DRDQFLTSMADSAIHAVACVHHHPAVEVSKCGVAISAVESVVHPPHDLDVLLRHRLLRKPGGFEGLFPIAVAIHARKKAIADDEEHGEGALDQSPARLAGASHAAEREHAVTEITVVVDFDAKVRPC